MIVTRETFNSAREKIKKEKKPIIFTSNNDSLNRKILEKEPIDILLISMEKRKDYSKQRNSGFNQVLGKIAKKNKISIGIDLDELINSNKKERIIARIKQNIKICKKLKIKMYFIGKKEKRNSHDLKSLGLSLGMPTWMTKEI
jgi:RNase P/RNase MRP subunit p30